VSHYRVSLITESPAKDSVPVLYKVSPPCRCLPPHEKVSVVGVTESPPRQSLPLPQPGNEHLCNVMQPFCGGCSVGVREVAMQSKHQATKKISPWTTCRTWKNQESGNYKWGVAPGTAWSSCLHVTPVARSFLVYPTCYTGPHGQKAHCRREKLIADVE